jgi:hypothetical protein
MLTQTAKVEIDRPARYGKQLASHMGNKIPAVEIEGGWKLSFDIGEATLIATDTQLVMQSSAENMEDLQKIQFALVKHLVKFAAKLGDLEIYWK